MNQIKRAKIKIKKGLIVRDPIKKAAHSGEVTVTLSSFWRRRIKCGDAELIKEMSVAVEEQSKKGESQKVEAPKIEDSKKSNKKSGGN